VWGERGQKGIADPEVKKVDLIVIYGLTNFKNVITYLLTSPAF
jgi:hypothetical protein